MAANYDNKLFPLFHLKYDLSDHHEISILYDI